MYKPDTSKKFYKWEVVILLWIAFFLNQADRQAFNIVLPQIQTMFSVSSSTMGIIAMLFNIFYAITVPFAGFYADRLSRSRQIILSTLIFSSATFFTGFSGGIFFFILFRCAGMGVGQGMFGPTYPGLIAEYHDSSTRARAMSFHQTSSYVGVICCGLLAGLIADRLGWQFAFFIFGGLGILLTVVLVFRLRDRQEATPVEVTENAVPKPSFGESVSAFFKVPTAICVLIAYTGGIFVITGYLTWMPKLMKETFDLSLATAGFHSMFWANVAAFVGVMLGGTVNDRLMSRSRNHGAGRLVIQSAGLLLAVPFIVLMGQSRDMVIMCSALVGFGLFRGVFESCTYPILFDVISSKYYSMATAVMILFGFSIGALAPWLLGIIGDKFGLAGGISLLGAVWVLVSIPPIIARLFFYRKDYSLAAEVE